LVKELTVKGYEARHGCKVLVESGSYRGEMIGACRYDFDEIYSIELSQHYFDKCCERYGDVENVHLVLGDSAKCMAGIVAGLGGKAIFWLDGHWSGGATVKADDGVVTPVLDELTMVLGDGRFRHVVLIDDAREFGKTDGWPSRNELIDHILKLRGDAVIDVIDDIVRVT